MTTLFTQNVHFLSHLEIKREKNGDSNVMKSPVTLMGIDRQLCVWKILTAAALFSQNMGSGKRLELECATKKLKYQTVSIRYLVGLCEKCRHASDVRPLEGARAVSMAIIFLDVRRGSIVELYKVKDEDQENWSNSKKYQSA